MIELERLIKRVRESKTTEERIALRLDIIGLMSSLGQQYASNMQSFSDSVIRNKEEWYKKSMIECIHQAGREVGYLHEAIKTDIEACKHLVQATYDIELVLAGELDNLSVDPESTDPSSTSEQSYDTEEEQKPMFGRTDDMEV